jgi:hypothetical protein
MHLAVTNGGAKHCLNISTVGRKFGSTKLAAAIRGVLMLAALSAVLLIASTASAQKPKITSVSKISAQQYQTITITGSGFGTQAAYTGDSDYIAFSDITRNWEAGYAPDGNTGYLIVNSWVDSQIVLGGFAGSYGENDWTLNIGDKVEIRVWNAQSGEGPASKMGVVVAEETTTTLTSSPNPSTYGEAVTFTADVASSGGTPPDGETVPFMEGKTVLGTGTLSGGSAQFTTSTLKVGTTSVTAVYGGDSVFKKSKSKPDKQVVQN